MVVSVFAIIILSIIGGLFRVCIWSHHQQQAAAFSAAREIGKGVARGDG